MYQYIFEYILNTNGIDYTFDNGIYCANNRTYAIEYHDGHYLINNQPINIMFEKYFCNTVDFTNLNFVAEIIKRMCYCCGIQHKVKVYKNHIEYEMTFPYYYYNNDEIDIIDKIKYDVINKTFTEYVRMDVINNKLKIQASVLYGIDIIPQNRKLDICDITNKISHIIPRMSIQTSYILSDLQVHMNHFIHIIYFINWFDNDTLLPDIKNVIKIILFELYYPIYI
jgi:hypothetical protein